MARSTSRTSKKVLLRPQNPFDLIRLLARSQSDPRKAVAELVQNSLDAGAKRIEIEWFNEKGRRALSIWDDGAGVFPEMTREDALRRIAKTIGHSHKQDLSPLERREQMVLGKYGIGLIGFWSVGEVLEMKSRVAGGKALVLRLREEQEAGEVFVSRSRTVGEDATYTQITIRGIHAAAISKIRPPRLQAFLSNELRGQLLDRGAVVRIRDRVARGRARKEFLVEPRPYLGQPLEEWRTLEVPGFEDARLELYLVSVDEGREGTVCLSCGGTLVLENIAEIDGGDALRSPWSGGRLEGVIDFPELHVAPSTRRGFAHDEPVAAFLAALGGLEAALTERLEEEQRRRAARKRVSVAREIQRAFRSVARLLPEYDLFPVPPTGRGDDKQAQGKGAEKGAAVPGSGATKTPSESEPATLPDPTADGPEPVAHLFPPGPLALLQIKPGTLRLAHNASRGLRARPLDEDERPLEDPVEITWRLEGPGVLESEDQKAVYRAPDLLDPALQTDESPTIRIHARAQQGESHSASASVRVQLQAAQEPGLAAAGIPEPHPVSAPGESWRSRLTQDRWEFNEAHRDYLAVAETEGRRLRYLIHLFAKEVVLRNFGRPGDTTTLERMVEVLTYLDRRGGRGVE